MIVHRLGGDRLWCINQTSHAVQAAAFCRRWGNAEVEPVPADLAAAVDLAVTVHDNGWLPWERRPELRPDGSPMDFLAGPVWHRKLRVWDAGIAAAFDQHPYAGALVATHAATLYERMVDQLPDAAERAATVAWVAAQARVLARARSLLGSVSSWRAALEDQAVLRWTRLLQFGDLASLRLCVPWSATSRTGGGVPMSHPPLDADGAPIELRMAHGNGFVHVDPWPFAGAGFEVAVWGRVLGQDRFSSTAAYRRALAQAPVMERRWWVSPNPGA
jgi:hypothetical protein